MIHQINYSPRIATDSSDKRQRLSRAINEKGAERGPDGQLSKDVSWFEKKIPGTHDPARSAIAGTFNDYT